MSRYTNCPHCGVSLLGDAIPEASRPYYPGTHFLREVVVEVTAVYDGGLYFACPDCHGAWHRWPKSHRLYLQAKPFVDAANAGGAVT